MSNSLARMRRAFGWSQEAMAATLEVDVRTIARWEAARPPNSNPFLNFVWVSATRYANRLYRYANALLPPDYIRGVRNSPYERSVYIGPEAVVLAMSEETRRTWGIFRHAEGMSVAAFSSKPERAMLAENYAVMHEICSKGDRTRLVNFVTSDAPRGSLPPLWRRHVMHAPFPEVFDMTSVPISEAEFAGTEPKFWISAARETYEVERVAESPAAAETRLGL